MPAAARFGDTSNHGGTLTGPGVPTVLIAGLPASVAGDLHACVIPPPHPPALRVSDVCGCGAMAAVGAPTVLIGG